MDFSSLRGKLSREAIIELLTILSQEREANASYVPEKRDPYIEHAVSIGRIWKESTLEEMMTELSALLPSCARGGVHHGA